jgi:N-acyl-D-aspartate/D-glutamate deacylase
MATLNHVFPLSGDGVLAYETTPEKSVVAIAARTGKEVGQVILDHVLATDLSGFFIVPLYNPDLDAAAAMLEHPLTSIGLGDSGAHTSQTCDASFATFLLAYWVRQRKLLSLETAIRKLSFDSALLWGLHDRGLLRHGAFADINVIDLDRLDVTPPELKHEFPTGAPHLTQDARGYVATVVNGKVLMRAGEHTGAFPGVLLRNELYAG